MSFQSHTPHVCLGMSVNVCVRASKIESGERGRCLFFGLVAVVEGLGEVFGDGGVQVGEHSVANRLPRLLLQLQHPRCRHH